MRRLLSAALASGAAVSVLFTTAGAASSAPTVKKWEFDPTIDAP